jgi:hypothetical protein
MKLVESNHLSAMKDQFLKGLNFVLMLDLFFVLASFGWFAIAILGRAAKVPLGLDLWLKLWDPVMQPAIGILMAGAILSGLSSWVMKRLNPDT